MENLEKLTELLKKVKVIQEREKELSILRGEHFNVFRILGMEADEAGLHTKFLFELLNPEGTHGKGKVFFDAFLLLLSETLMGEIKIPGYSRIVEKKSEKYIGQVDFETEDGGGIDLYFETDSFCLVIENKIYAKLQKKQLERYHSFICNKKEKIPILLLLTPSGYREYFGKLNEGKDFFQITYEDFVLKWLNVCHQEASDSPILRETIKQYIIVIKGLLGDLTNHKMDTELQHLMNLYLEEAKLIHDNLDKVISELKKKLYGKTIDCLNAELKKRGNYEQIILKENGIEQPHGGFSIRNQEWIPGLSLYFEGDPKLAENIKVQIFFDRRNWTNESWKEKYERELKGKVVQIQKPNSQSEGYDRITRENFNLHRFFGNLKNDNLDSIAKEFASEMILFLDKNEKTINTLNQMFKQNGIS